MHDHIALPHCRHRITAAGPHETRRCCTCDANLGHAAELAFRASIDGEDAEPEPKARRRDYFD